MLRAVHATARLPPGKDEEEEKDEGEDEEDEEGDYAVHMTCIGLARFRVRAQNRDRRRIRGLRPRDAGPRDGASPRGLGDARRVPAAMAAAVGAKVEADLGAGAPAGVVLVAVGDMAEGEASSHE